MRASLISLVDGSGGRHDNYGSALAAQPGESQRRPATNTSSQLIVRIGLPAPSCSRCPCPGWSHHTPRSENRSRTSAPTSSYRLPTPSRDCTKNSSDGSRRRPCCPRPIPLPCCSGRCSPQDRSTCARSTVGKPSPQSPSLSQLTSPPDRILSTCSEIAPSNSNHIPDGTAGPPASR